MACSSVWKLVLILGLVFGFPTSLLWSTESETKKGDASRTELPLPPERVADSAAQSRACVECHVEIEELLLGDRHIAKDFHCVTCHGPSKAHLTLEQEGALPDRVFRRWREEQVAFEWRVEDASLKLAKYCASCHGRKPPEGEERATIRWPAFLKTGHGVAMLAGSKDSPTCTDCHYAHGVGCEPLTDDVVVERCAICHADPDMMERAGIDPNVVDDFDANRHADMASVEDEGKRSCITCHYPH